MTGMRRIVAVIPAVLIALAVAMAGCGAGASFDPGVDRCVAEWNGPSNAANRAVVARTAAGDDVEVIAWNAASPPGPGARGDGCGYNFFDGARRVSVSAYWTVDETLRWDRPIVAPQGGLTFRPSGAQAQRDGRIG